MLLAALVGGAVLAGCGGASSGAVASSSKGFPGQRRPWRTQALAPALAACRGPVIGATSLSASEKGEIAHSCDRMDERVLENEAIVRAVCQELASATSSSPTAPSTRRVAADCYAGYERTIPVAERLHAGAGSGDGT